MMGKDDLWKAVLGELEVSLPRASFAAWFKKTSLVSEEEGRIVISVLNVFAQAWFKANYHKHILNAFTNILGKVESIEYIVGTKGEPEEKILENKDEAVAVVEEVREIKEGNINSKYTFDSFIVGSSNKLAFAVTQAVAKQPGKQYNPLFLYGGVGLGKTHLMQSLGNAVLEKYPDKKVVYLPAEKFTNEFIESIVTRRTEAFKNKYRKVDVLLLDDVHFIAGKESTKEEFFHTFNALFQEGKQIVLSSDRPPKAIPTLEDRLISRFESGMMADIQPPDLETRIAILQMKSKKRGYVFSLDIVDYIARNIQQNIRELEGALTRVIAYFELNGGQPSLEAVKQILGSSNSRKKTVNIKTVVDKIASFYDLSTEELLGKRRAKEIVVPRQILMYLLREELRLSFPKIGTELGGKDHTTVMHAVSKIGKQIDVDEGLRHEVSMIKERLYA